MPSQSEFVTVEGLTLKRSLLKKLGFVVDPEDDVRGDLDALRTGRHTAQSLLDISMGDSGFDDRQRWRDYVDALVRHIAAEERKAT